MTKSETAVQWHEEQENMMTSSKTAGSPITQIIMLELGGHPLLRRTRVILCEDLRITSLPTSCRHLFLSVLPDVIIIRDLGWTFVAHGLVFR